MIDLTNLADIVSHPGKFEGEPVFAPYYWDQAMEGNSEFIYPDGCNQEDVEDSNFFDCFGVNAEESDAFDLPIGTVVLIREDSQGFVIAHTEPDMESARAYVNSYFG